MGDLPPPLPPISLPMLVKIKEQHELDLVVGSAHHMPMPGGYNAGHGNMGIHLAGLSKTSYAVENR